MIWDGIKRLSQCQQSRFFCDITAHRWNGSIGDSSSPYEYWVDYIRDNYDVTFAQCDELCRMIKDFYDIKDFYSKSYKNPNEKKFKMIVYQKVWDVYDVSATNLEEAMEIAINEHLNTSLNGMNTDYPKVEVLSD